MEIIFLGTSSGTPTKTRNVSGVVVRKANSKSWYLIDCGEGTQHQILHTNLALNNLQVIFITHVHGDHCYGLPGLLASASLSGRTELLTIVCPRPIIKYFETTQETTQLRLSFDIHFIPVEEFSGALNTKEFDVEFIELSHRVPSFAFVFCENNIQCKLNVSKLTRDGIESGPDWGRLQKGEDVSLPDGRIIKGADYLLEARNARKIVFSGDNDTPNLLSEISKPVDVLIHESTYTDDVANKVGKGPQHSSAKMIAQFANEASIRHLILTHFSPRYQDKDKGSPSIDDIEKEAKKYYTGNLFLANDLDIFYLNTDGELHKSNLR